MMLWKEAVGALETRGALGRILQREDEEQFQCPFSKNAPEDKVHLLVKCNVAAKVWRVLPWAIQMGCVPLSTPAELINAISNA